MMVGVLGLAACSLETPIGELQSDLQTPATTTASSSTSADDPRPETEAASDTVTDTDGPGLTSSTTAGGSESTGSNLTPQMTAFAVRWGDVPEDDDESNSGVGSGSGPDPDALLVRVGFTTSRCEEPFVSGCGIWSIGFTLEPDQQVVGTFDGADVNAGFSEAGPGSSPDECSFGGGTFETTVVIESIDDTGVQVRFENVDALFDPGIELEGFSTFAPRC